LTRVIDGDLDPGGLSVCAMMPETPTRDRQRGRFEGEVRYSGAAEADDPAHCPDHGTICMPVGKGLRLPAKVARKLVFARFFAQARAA